MQNPKKKTYLFQQKSIRQLIKAKFQHVYVVLQASSSDTMNKTKDKKCDMGELHKKKNKKKSVNLMLC